MRCWLICAVLLVSHHAAAQETAERDVVVTASGEEFEDLGGYGQPQWAERSRASSTTKLYVLSPYEFFAGILSENDFHRGGRSTHDLMQEIELGLPHRFEIGFENNVGIGRGDVSERTVGIEARYAFAEWDKLPLNPAISSEYKFGVGRPDAYEARLLLGTEIVRVQWAANLFFEQELGGDRNRKAGFTQDAAYVIVPDKFTFGAEMRYAHETNRDGRDEFVIGPSVSWKPNRHTVVDLAPLLGCTSDSPRVATFVTVSFEFGGAESHAPGGAGSANR